MFSSKSLICRFSGKIIAKLVLTSLWRVNVYVEVHYVFFCQNVSLTVTVCGCNAALLSLFVILIAHSHYFPFQACYNCVKAFSATGSLCNLEWLPKQKQRLLVHPKNLRQNIASERNLVASSLFRLCARVD